jgi:hypothetical protein
VGAHVHCPKSAAGRTCRALPLSTANSRPRLCYGHAFSAWQLRCAIGHGNMKHKESAAGRGRSGSKARRRLLLTRARTVSMLRCRVSWFSGL